MWHLLLGSSSWDDEKQGTQMEHLENEESRTAEKEEVWGQLVWGTRVSTTLSLLGRGVLRTCYI